MKQPVIRVIVTWTGWTAYPTFAVQCYDCNTVLFRSEGKMTLTAIQNEVHLHTCPNADRRSAL